MDIVHLYFGTTAQKKKKQKNEHLRSWDYPRFFTGCFTVSIFTECLRKIYRSETSFKMYNQKWLLEIHRLNA